jgi:hypothetical protein
MAVLLGMGLFAAPALAAERANLGTMPAYPGASKPLRHWDTDKMAFATTPDRPEAVIAYYMATLPRAGWKPAPGAEAEAIAAASADEPVWLTFLRPGQGRLDIQLTRGKSGKTGQWLTLITTQSSFKL